MANPLAAAVALQRQAHTPSRTAQRSASYAGTQVTAQTAADWVFATLRSANQDVRGSHRRLTDRARDLGRNDPYCKKFLGLLARKTVGPHGINLQAQVEGPDGELDEAANSEIEDAFRRWSLPETCTVDGRHSWVEVQQLAMKDWARDGEALIRMVGGFDNEFGFALQRLDPDQLDIEFSRPASKTDNEIRMGVEIDRWGRPVAYWLWTEHPSEHGRPQRKRIRVPAEEIIYLGLLERAGQVRAVTWFASIILSVRMLGAYREAELTAARIHAAASVVFQQDPEAPTPVADPDDPDLGDEEDEEAEEFEFEMTPGGGTVLPPGLIPHQLKADHPNSAYPDFEKGILGGVAAGLDSAYASLTGDLTKVNYSSIRTGSLDEVDVYKTLQVILAMHLNRRVYLEWLKWALTTGAVQQPLADRRRLQAHKWFPRGFPWIDPDKDMNAGLNSVDASLDSLTRLAAEQGRDLEEVLKERQREIRLAKKYGVPIRLPSDKRASKQAPAREEEEDGEDE